MKKIALTLFGLAVVVFSIAQELALKTSSHPGLFEETAVFAWNTTTFDFGKITVGVPVKHAFSFVNTGAIPLVISSVQASCGCTVTSYSKDPIAPGASGFVTATYNAAKAGQFTKTVTVNANTDDGIVQLTIQGEVIE